MVGKIKFAGFNIQPMGNGHKMYGNKIYLCIVIAQSIFWLIKIFDVLNSIAL